MSIELIIGAWVATGLTLFIFTFLYKDNPLFKLAENLYVGVSVNSTRSVNRPIKSDMRAITV